MFAKSTMRLVAASLALPLMFLAGCGGGNNNGITPTPTPTSGANPTPTPSPTPADVPSATVIGLTANNQLVRFNTRTPGTTTALSVSGLGSGENLLAIDFRFAPSGGATTGLYGLSRRANGSFQLLRIDINNNAATLSPVGAGFNAPGATGDVGFDFNPNVLNPDGSRVDRIRVVSPERTNFRLNPDTGAVVDSDAATPGVQGDGLLTFAAGDVNQNVVPRVVGAAYTNNDSDASTGTVNYALDAFTNTLVTQGRPASGSSAAVSPNTGQLFTVGRLGINLSGLTGFDIAPGNNTAFLSTESGLYTVDLGTGRATLVGTVGVTGSPTLLGLAIVP